MSGDDIIYDLSKYSGYMYSLLLFYSGPFHLVEHFYPHPDFFHVPPPAVR